MFEEYMEKTALGNLLRKTITPLESLKKIAPAIKKTPTTIEVLPNGRVLNSSGGPSLPPPGKAMTVVNNPPRIPPHPNNYSTNQVPPVNYPLSKAGPMSIKGKKPRFSFNINKDHLKGLGVGSVVGYGMSNRSNENNNY